MRTLSLALGPALGLALATATLTWSPAASADVVEDTGGDDDDDDDDDDKGCSHVSRMATPATGLSLLVGGALLVGLRRRG